MGATPRGDGGEVVNTAGRVARAVHPQDERPVGGGRVDGLEVDASVDPERDRHRPAAGEDGPHLVGRVRRGRVEHGVAIGTAQAQPLRQGADELLAPDGSPDRRRAARRRRTGARSSERPPRGKRRIRCSAGTRARPRTSRRPPPRQVAAGPSASRSRGRRHRRGSARRWASTVRDGRTGTAEERSRRPRCRRPPSGLVTSDPGRRRSRPAGPPRRRTAGRGRASDPARRSWRRPRPRGGSPPGRRRARTGRRARRRC